VLLQNGKYLCTLCGEQIDISADDRPRAVIKASSGAPNMRAIMLGDKEIHACPVDPNASRP
jgi:hypothetical protein